MAVCIIRWTTLTPTPSSRAIRLMPLPSPLVARMTASLARGTLGRPNRFSCALARSRPALARFRISLIDDRDFIVSSSDLPLLGDSAVADVAASREG